MLTSLKMYEEPPKNVDTLSWEIVYQLCEFVGLQGTALPSIPDVFIESRLNSWGQFPNLLLAFIREQHAE